MMPPAAKNLFEKRKGEKGTCKKNCVSVLLWLKIIFLVPAWPGCGQAKRNCIFSNDICRK